MNCTTVKKLFSEEFDGRLGDVEQDRFDGHLRLCTTCAEEHGRYGRMFMTVRSLPAAEMSRPAPFPETATAFFGPRRESVGRRLARVAGVGLLLMAVGTLAYQTGRRMQDDGPSPVGEIARNEALDVSFVSKPAGERLRRCVNGVSHLGAVVEAAANRPDERLARMIGAAFEQTPTLDDAQALLDMDEHSLGRTTETVHAFGREIVDVMGRVRVELRDHTAPLARLRSAQRLLGASQLVSRMEALRGITDLFDPTSYPGAAIVDRNSDDVSLFVEGLNHSICGRSGKALDFFQLILSRKSDVATLPPVQSLVSRNFVFSTNTGPTGFSLQVEVDFEEPPGVSLWFPAPRLERLEARGGENVFVIKGKRSSDRVEVAPRSVKRFRMRTTKRF